MQIVVEVDDAQLTRLRQSVQFDPWLKEILSQVPREERSGYALRADDLFVQQVCRLKLHLAILQGIRQENCKFDCKTLEKELEEAVLREDRAIKDQVFAELDIHSWEES